MNSYLDNWNSIFNKNQHRLIRGEGKLRKKSATTTNKKKRKAKKELCPHCATNNLIRIDDFEVKCKKCKYER